MIRSGFRKWTARQRNRLYILRSAFFGDHELERVALIESVVRRLPVTDQQKRKAADWLLKGFGSGRFRLRQKIRVAQSKWDAKGHAHLNRLLAGSETIAFPSRGEPLVSIILVTRNKAHLTLLTLESIQEFASIPYELVLVDNGSHDSTSALLDRLEGATVLRNPANLGFGPACMQAVELAHGQYLCFFNNDALLSKGALEAALKNFESADIGAIGGKILLANGALQEAGSIIWSDGSALGYGRGDDPDFPQYNFRRPVDYCSGVFLITPASLFRKFGGFRQEFAPAYYEDTDYCMTLWQNSYRVMYEPAATILHYESASSGGNDLAVSMMAAHQAKFADKWYEALRHHYPPLAKNICAARISVNSQSLRIVYIDDRIPQRSLGAGFPRSNDIVTALSGMGHHVVCCNSTFPLTANDINALPPEVEIFDGYRNRDKLVSEYMPAADVVWVSRPHNLKLLLQAYPDVLSSRKFDLLYDAEAIFAPRTRARTELLGPSVAPGSPLEPSGLEEEIALAKIADSVIVVSEADRQVMQRGGVDSLHIVGHSISITPTTSPFQQRDAFLFIGAIHGLDNPNADSIRAFCNWQWDRIHQATGADFLVAGYGTEILRNEISRPGVVFLGRQEDPRSLYERARIFVVPTRFAAGMPYKAHEAAAFGVPLVVSPLIASQMQWCHGTDYFAGEELTMMAEYCIQLYQDEQLWQRFRRNGLARVESELSPAAFKRNLCLVLSQVSHKQGKASPVTTWRKTLSEDRCR